MKQFIDLGLPSGLLWADTNEEGYLSFDEAREKFGDDVPSISEWKEIQYNCMWQWNKEKNGYDVIGRNGNSIFLPTDGFRLGEHLYGAGSSGFYWSSSIYTGFWRMVWFVFFASGSVIKDITAGRNYGHSVRLIKKK